MGYACAGLRKVISAEAIGGLGEFLWYRWMKYEDKRMEMMKERSSAVAMMVLHMSSHMVSVERRLRS